MPEVYPVTQKEETPAPHHTAGTPHTAEHTSTTGGTGEGGKGGREGGGGTS